MLGRRSKCRQDVARWQSMATPTRQVSAGFPSANSPMSIALTLASGLGLFTVSLQIVFYLSFCPFLLTFCPVLINSKRYMYCASQVNRNSEYSWRNCRTISVCFWRCNWWKAGQAAFLHFSYSWHFVFILVFQSVVPVSLSFVKAPTPPGYPGSKGHKTFVVVLFQSSESGIGDANQVAFIYFSCNCDILVLFSFSISH